MDQTLKLLAKFNQEFLYIAVSVLLLILALIIVYWVYYRKRLHDLTHQIPASVVKNYLDSIIANSNALKSSLFRGGGLEIGEGVPSVVPTHQLPSGGVSSSDGSAEELAQKNAEIANLRAQNLERDKTITELEAMLANAGGETSGSGEEVSKLNAEIARLNAELEKSAQTAPSSEGGDGELKAELEKVTQERDEYKERLMEYEIIEEDLANLKRFQQENEALKKTIEELKGGASEAPSSKEQEPAEEAVEEPAAKVEEPVEEPEVQEEPAEEAEETEEAAPAKEEVTAEENPNASDEATEAAAEEMPEVPSNDGEQKSAEELLSEFEKMLG